MSKAARTSAAHTTPDNMYKKGGLQVMLTSIEQVKKRNISLSTL